ncbi:CYTH domain-containing protein [Paraneptunicella aestuarii]|uniref:CYTH domain-containing protein n=1 Tax=Paraneptunicella aestuarii TaxID=2831148 RepID=UPI001E39341F|nr:CYTH domain-containing protein [Paraneptunicella aestuarii]UAA38113.1 CYTH domain-containing protein [Paraneptunicella aestuarii]
MADEIELKLLVSPDAGKQLESCFVENLATKYSHESCLLYNSYYDTPDRALNRMEMACRVRGKDGVFEQTIKTRGSVVGGLHQRPEYNVAIEGNTPNLKLFTDVPWPDGVLVDELQDQLTCLFDTQFQREIYLLDYAGSEVELVFDSGAIETAKHQESICEIELELKHGNPKVLVELSQKLLDRFNFRLGSQSKAQRGYRLVDGIALERLRLRESLPQISSGSLEDALLACLQKVLEHWQHCEQVFIEEKKLRELRSIARTIRFLQFFLTQFGKQLDCEELLEVADKLKVLESSWKWTSELDALRELRSKKGAFRKKLASNERLRRELKASVGNLLEKHRPENLIQDKSYVSVQLDILSLLVERPWRVKSKGYLERIETCAVEWVKNVAHEIKQVLNDAGQISKTQYLAQTDLLRRMWYMDLFLSDELMSVVATDELNWKNILDGIRELHTLRVLENHLSKSQLEEKDVLMQWCHTKQQHMLELMDEEKYNFTQL